MGIGNIICLKRDQLGMTQVELAKKVGVARQTVSSWENDVFSPNTPKVIAMSQIFNCSTDDLLNPDFSRNSDGGVKQEQDVESA